MRSSVITGCGSGIGLAVINRISEEGYFAVGVERDERTAALLSDSLGERGAVVVGDVRDRNVLNRAAKIATDSAPLGCWINNVGVVLRGSLLTADPEDVEAVLQVNLMSYFWGSKIAVGTFVAQGSGGSIVNISSIHGRASFPGYAAYDMVKGGIDALTRNTAVEYGPVGIRANAVAPGAIRTELLADVISRSSDPQREEQDMVALHPLGRLGEPPEIAAVVYFLASDQSSFISGQSIAVDGAATARCYRYEPDPDLLATFAAARGLS